MSVLFAAPAVVQASGHPSVWHNIIHSLPRDPVSLFTLALVVAAGVLVVTAGRRGNRDSGEGGDDGLPS